MVVVAWDAERERDQAGVFSGSRRNRALTHLGGTGYSHATTTAMLNRVNREMMKEYRGCLIWVLVLLVCLLMIVFANQVLAWVDDTIG